ncbi:putative cystathionine gamma-lyase 2 [Bradysia coprophila]|uniref:putative cystathionine gamma-lyase 2 n=1 Tax=Bradysia coprophila TaxID=38358 RepID=UPI00187DC72D|nr:putative cystathionine gamma-lyase 2 [Bradysia coprophila]
MSEFKKQVEGFATKAIHVEQETDSWSGKQVVQPIVTTTIIRQEEPDSFLPHHYGRTSNTTRSLLEKCLASLDNGNYCLAFSSGQAAAASVTSILASGDHVLCAEGIYSGAPDILKSLEDKGIRFESVDFTDLNNVRQGIKTNTRMIWMESITNPLLNVLDIEGVCEIAHSHPNVVVVVDNTFLTSYYQRPLELGADIVLYSLSKYLSGHSDLIMGAIVLNDPEIYARLKYVQQTHGAISSPFDCYQAQRSLKTLAVRMKQHGKSAYKIAQFLSTHPAIEKVLHPALPSHPQHHLALKQSYGHSGIISFYVKGGYKNTRKFLLALRIIMLCGSLGGVESVASIPAFWWADGKNLDQLATLGITSNFVRLSVGLEDCNDLIRDLERALNLSQTTGLTILRDGVSCVEYIYSRCMCAVKQRTSNEYSVLLQKVIRYGLFH